MPPEEELSLSQRLHESAMDAARTSTSDRSSMEFRLHCARLAKLQFELSQIVEDYEQ